MAAFGALYLAFVTTGIIISLHFMLSRILKAKSNEAGDHLFHSRLRHDNCLHKNEHEKAEQALYSIGRCITKEGHRIAKKAREKRDLMRKSANLAMYSTTYAPDLNTGLESFIEAIEVFSRITREYLTSLPMSVRYLEVVDMQGEVDELCAGLGHALAELTAESRELRKWMRAKDGDAPA